MHLQSKLWSYLDAERLKSCAEICNKRKRSVEKAEKMHYETIHYKQCALTGNQMDAIAYLEKWNVVAGVKPMSSATATKTVFIEQMLERTMAKHQEGEKKKRFEARLCRETMGDPPTTEENYQFFDACDNMDPPTTVDETHYSVLGVSPTADKREIMSAFRQKSLTCHPDKNNVSSQN